MGAMMAHIRVVFGPPGTGKTTRLLGLLDEELERGTRPDRIGFVTFTRAAKAEAVDRALHRYPSLDPERDLVWFRTVHAACFKLLRLHTGSMLTGSAWNRFAREHGYQFSEFHTASVDGYELPRRTEDDRTRFVLEWGASRRLSPAEAAARANVHADPAAVLRLHDRLTDWKHAQNLLTFHDLIDRALYARLTLPVDVLFVDEAQDLSPAQIAVVEMWIEETRRTIVGGDDDQAIYAFSGAEPDWLVKLRDRADTIEVLDQSYRVPARVHELARRIIEQNVNRVPKDYRPRAELGAVEHMSRADAARRLPAHLHARPDKTAFILARNRAHLHPWAEILTDSDVPFILEGPGGTNPLGDPAKADAVRAALRVKAGETLTAEAFRTLIAQIPSRNVPGIGKLLDHGSKTAAENLHENVSPESMAVAWGMVRWLELLHEVGAPRSLLAMPGRERDYFHRLIDRAGGVVLPEPRVVLTTVHGAKGREADLVILSPDMTRATWEEFCGRGSTGHEGRESENRVAYVGVTRSRNELWLQAPETKNFYPYSDLAGASPRGAEAARPSDPAKPATWRDDEELPF